MKKIKKYIIMLLFLLGIFFNITEVNATENEEYVKCYYDLFSVYYNRTTDEFTTKLTVENPSHLVLNTKNLVKSNFINKGSNELYCPTLYRTTSTSGSSISYTYYASKQNEQSNSIEVLPDKDQSEIVNNGNGNNVNTKSCVFYTGNGTAAIEYILDIDNKSIKSLNVKGNDIAPVHTYNELYDGQNCKNIKMYYFCYTYNNISNCVVSKTKTDNNYIEVTLDKKTSTGSTDDSTTDTPAEKCEVLPEAIKNYIMQALKLIRWGGLVLMIVLGTLDFVKASAADDQDAIKKAGQNFIKRLIAVIILFLLPILVELILFIAGKIGFNFGECYKVSEF